MDARLQWFERLYDAHADAIFRHLYMRLGDRERAKELTQEVFLKTWQYVMLGKTITHEKAFLYRIARNLFINEIRTDRRTHSLETLEDAGFEPADTRSATDATAHARELMDRLGSLSDEYVEVMTLRHIDGLAVKEIAEMLDMKETAVSMRLARALEALRKVYADKQ